MTPAFNMRPNVSQKIRKLDTLDRMTYDSQALSQQNEIDLAPLKISDFKIDEHLMSKELKDKMAYLKRKFKRVDEEFLSLFEKRYIIFIEDGVDLQKDCKIFKEKANLQEQQRK